MPDSNTEVALSPEKARNWLLATGRACEDKGQLTPVEAGDHLTLAGISIASGNEAMLLSEVYIQVSPNVPHISALLIANIASIASRSYSSSNF